MSGKTVFTAKQKIEQNFMKGKIAALLDQIYRIKRFLMIYTGGRVDKLERNFFEFGGQISNDHFNVDYLSEEEKKYFNNYKELIGDYMDDIGLDLTVDLDPPMDVSIEIRFLKDCGQILNDSGDTILLEKNSVFYIKKRII